jgi:hypothetical protein
MLRHLAWTFSIAIAIVPIVVTDAAADDTLAVTALLAFAIGDH